MELKGKDSIVAAGESIKTEAVWSPLCRAIYSISVGHAFDDPQHLIFADHTPEDSQPPAREVY